jgi:hypothetical protein
MINYKWLSPICELAYIKKWKNEYKIDRKSHIPIYIQVKKRTFETEINSIKAS